MPGAVIGPTAVLIRPDGYVAWVAPAPSRLLLAGGLASEPIGGALGAAVAMAGGTGEGSHMHTTVQRVGIAAAMTMAALAVTAGPAQGAQSTITLSIGDQSSPITGYSWGASNPGSTHAGGGGGAGKVNVQDLSVSKETDAMTPSLIRAVATGEHLQQVAVQFTNGVFTSSYCLRDALVSTVSNSASAGQERPTDTVSFNFARFTFKVGTTAFAFNIVENAPDTNPC